MVPSEVKIKIVQIMAKQEISSFSQFEKSKHKAISLLKSDFPPHNELLKTYRDLRKDKKIPQNLYFEKLLKKRPIRTLSGVAVVAVLTKPWPCPGKCIYCPSEKNVPQSYLSGEPAVERAKALDYDPYFQTKKRIEMLEKNGHPTDKIELIVIGGTWSYLPKKYQTWFIKRCFDAANSASQPAPSLIKAQKRNERSKHRLIGITLETRPDYINLAEIKRMRRLGCTRVEIGVQITDNQILNLNQRGHSVESIIKATKLLKNAGLKICYHFMPGLWGSNPQKDLEKFQELFTSPEFQPDMLKIYPCVVTKGSKLYELWKKNKYHPYDDNTLIELLIKMKSIVPPYVRINRVIRDIPSWQIEGGSKISNLRQYLATEMRKQNISCQCIRCREIKSSQVKIQELKLKKYHYPASGGEEIFFSFETKKDKKLVAFLRLRWPAKLGSSEQLPVLRNKALIRELHTYGQLVSLEKRNQKAAQHFGLGKKLIKLAEQMSKEKGYQKIAIIAGVGVREYYRHLGYRLQETYMVKTLAPRRSLGSHGVGIRKSKKRRNKK